VAYQVIMPKLTNEMHEGRILEWLCSEGEAVTVGRPLFVVETDKAATEVPAEHLGTLRKILVEAGSTVGIGATVAWIGTPSEAIPEVVDPAPPTESEPRITTKPARPSADAAAGVEDSERVLASPIAKRLARELGVDLRAVREHTGRRRIRETDVQAYHDRAMVTTASPRRDPVSEAQPEAEFTLVEPTPLEQTMAARMTESASVPQLAAARDVDLTALERFRGELLSDWKARHGFRLTYTHIFAALVSRALEDHPRLNASWTPDGIRLYHGVNLGVAMATERGLVVPVVQRANHLSLEEISREIVRLQRGSEGNRLAHEDLSGGTFTLTNVGMLGITLSIPLLNPPQSGILAVAAKRAHAVVESGELKSIPVTTLTAVADHRVVDGAGAAAFLRRLSELAQNPETVLLEGLAAPGIPQGE
jgi:pyruvate dehydrogenase E2 component (dihydrolipoamide acetyltransferase)